MHATSFSLSKVYELARDAPIQTFVSLIQTSLLLNVRLTINQKCARKNFLRLLNDFYRGTNSGAIRIGAMSTQPRGTSWLLVSRHVYFALNLQSRFIQSRLCNNSRKEQVVNMQLMYACRLPDGKVYDTAQKIRVLSCTHNLKLR